MLAVNHEALGERVGYSGVIPQIMETYDEPPMGNKGSIVLQIKSISKQYKTGDFVQKALDDVSLNLRDSEFVAILGPSGSGKTTLLNIIGGLDRYDSGDLIINGVSTKRYKDRDWDSYRNHTIGFVFQSYNLIPHQTILSNVELALTISGVSRTERRERARKALEQVGLGDHINKKPNQLSGGQMDIVLADEPTGALDSDTSVQIMNLLKEVAKDRLVVMVTHNPELAEQYATRTVRLRDGVIRSDSDPYEVEEGASEAPVHKRLGKASMSLATSIALSFNNLRTKKGRTLLTSFAGSIGIIGIALILSLSSGINDYIGQVQEDTLTSYPITIQGESVDMTSIMGAQAGGKETGGKSAKNDGIYPDDRSIKQTSSLTSSITKNNLADFKKYLDDPNSEISKRIAQGKVTQLECLGNQGSPVVHLNIPSRFLAGTVFLPAEEEEVAIGAHVKATCECGTVFEMDTNWAGDWEFEDLPKNKKFTIEITMDGFKSVTYEAFTDADHYVAETYLERV